MSLQQKVNYQSPNTQALGFMIGDNNAENLLLNLKSDENNYQNLYSGYPTKLPTMSKRYAIKQ